MKDKISRHIIPAIQCECAKVENLHHISIYNKEKEEDFVRLYEKKYDELISKFMKNTKVLDSHKQAALITITCLESEIIKYRLENNEQFSILPQIIAINIGLSYMMELLNVQLKKKLYNPIDKYEMPVAIACETPYIEIMSRLLYQAETYSWSGYNVLDLADRYFLLEYITLLQNGIEPLVLKHV